MSLGFLTKCLGDGSAFWAWWSSIGRRAGLGRKMRRWSLARNCCDSHDAGQCPWKQRQGTLALPEPAHQRAPLLFPTCPQLLSPPTLRSTNSRTNKGHWLPGEKLGLRKGRRAGAKLPTKWLLELACFRHVFSTLAWANEPQRAKLSFVCHFEVFQLIKIYASRRV